jgi:glutamate-1-semialdehyde aminotransferase
MSVTAEETIAPVVVEAVVAEVTAVDAVKTFSMDELKELTDKKNLHMLIHGKVYAITKFMDEVSLRFILLFYGTLDARSYFR